MSTIATPRVGFMQVNRAKLYFEERGSGRPVVFIPGGTVDAKHFAEVAEALGPDIHTVTYDRRANSNSPRPDGWFGTSIAEQADDVAGLIEGLGLAPCAVWGGSLGGVILLELLIRRPGLVRTAIVQEPPLFAVLDDGEQIGKGLSASAARAIRENAVRDGFSDHARQSLGAAFDGLSSEARERMFANAQVFFDIEIPALVDYRPDLVGALGRIDIPVHVMADPQNGQTPPGRAARWLADFFGTGLGDLPGGHVPYITEPENTAAAIRAVLEEE